MCFVAKVIIRAYFPSMEGIFKLYYLFENWEAILHFFL
jgi:hypothetical protein